MATLKSRVKSKESDFIKDFLCAFPLCRAILFDLDDTLIDFKASEIQSLQLVHENFYKGEHL